MNIFCLGLSHQTASVDVRERFAVPDATLGDALKRFIQIPEVEEGVILSTCNRTEFYFTSQRSQLQPELVVRDFYVGLSEIDHSHFYRFASEHGVRHLFRVVAGLDSMVVGETEIFGQVKRAYEIANQLGTTRKYLNKLFQKSFNVGKQIRSSTGITRGSISVGSVAVDLAEQIFGKLDGCKIMILGAGEMGEKTGRAFQSRGAHQIFVSNRSYPKAESLAVSMGARAIRFDDWEKEFGDVDVLVNSTAAPHVLVTPEKLEPVLKSRRDRPLFIIDLSIPRNVDPAVNRMDGVYLYDIDSLQTIAQKSLEARKKEAELSENLIQRHVEEFHDWMNRSVSSTPLPVISLGCPGR